MYLMHEALARERMQSRYRRDRNDRLSRELAAARRWQLLERRARAAAQRHRGRADLLTAVAE